MEIWKKIKGFEDYEASNMGEIRSLKKGGNRILIGGNCHGYRRGIFDGKGKYFHRLILETFSPVEKKLEVNHKNGIKTDNRLENLEWVTPSQNVRHAWKIGLNENARYQKAIGELHGRSTLTEKQVRVIKYALLFGGRGIQTYLAKIFKVHQPVISRIYNGITWKQVLIT